MTMSQILATVGATLARCKANGMDDADIRCTAEDIANDLAGKWGKDVQKVYFRISDYYLAARRKEGSK